MDKSEFVGWNVRVTTKNNSVIEGYVSEVNEADSRLILIDTEVFIGNKSRQVELVSVQGEDIVDLQVISNATPASKQHIQTKSKDKKAEYPLTKDPAILRTSSDKLSLASSLHPLDSRRTAASWAPDNVKDFKNVDFDFQTNLQLFDKKKTFELLKGSLKHEDLLATNNISSKPTAAINKSASLPSIPAQLSSAIPSSGKSIAKEKLFEEPKPPRKASVEDQLMTASQQPVRILQKPVAIRKETEDLEERREELSRMKIGKEEFLSVVGSINNVRVPLASEESITLIEQKTSKLTGPTTDQQMESAAREIVRVLLNEELVGIPSSAAVLAGNHRDGAIAIAVGRTLANRGVSVSAYFSSSTLMDHVAFQKKLFTSAGGKCVELADGHPFSLLPNPPDVVIDGVLGREGIKDADFKKFIGLFDSSFVASIERPLVKSQCVFTTVFPKKFHGQTDRDYRLYLIDINIPVSTLRTVLADYNPSTLFGTKMSVRLR